MPSRPAATPQRHRVLLAMPPERATPGLLRALRMHAFDPVLIHDGTRVLDTVQAAGFAAVVVDAGLTGVDTTAVLTGLARLAADLPVLCLISRESRDQVLGALRGDRDDFLTTPFNADELVARLRLRARISGTAGRTGEADEPTLTRHGDIMVDTALGLVSVDGQLVTLTPTEFALLTILIDNPGQVLPRERLTAMLWRDPPSSNVIEVYIGYLRRKLGADRIRTVRGRGYLLQE